MATRPATPSDRTNNHTPNRFEIDQAANDLVVTYGAVIMSDARRYSACTADAEDAYQRALEILVTKAPTTDPEHLVPWIRTVVRREAVAIMKSRHRQRTISLDQSGELFEELESFDITPEEYAELSNDIAAGTEALTRLSPDQVSCLLAQAEGFTYEEICAATGFSRRKVTRCVFEGRQSFLRKVDAIESGSECARVNELLHKLVDGDGDAAIEVRPHLANCPSCRNRLHTYRKAPSSVAALFPPAIVLVDPPSVSYMTSLLDQCTRVSDWLALKLFRAQHLSEVGAAQKSAVAVGIASTAIAGGLAINGQLDGSPGLTIASPESEVRGQTITVPAEREETVSSSSAARKSVRAKRRRSKADQELSPSPSATSPQSNPEQTPASAPSSPRVDDGSSEFLPEAR